MVDDLTDLNIIHTICPYCGCGCGIDLIVKDNKIVGTYPFKRHPINEGKTCIKGNYCYEFVHSKDRLKKPLIKKNGKFVESTWDEALNLIASKLKEYSPNEVGFFSSARCTNEDNYIFQKFARVVVKTNNIDHCARICHSSTVTGLRETLGSGAMTNTIEDIEESDCILIIGSNTFEQHPLIGRRVIRAKERGAKIIYIDPRKTITAKNSDIFIQINPGTNVALINGIINVIIKNDWIDKDFIKNRTEGFENLKKVVEKYTPEYVSKICNVPSNLIEKVAKIYATSERSSILYSMGITQFTHGVDNVKSICNLALITGNIGKRGTGINPLRGQNNVQGACDMGSLPNYYPGYQEVNNPEIYKKFEKYWNTQLNHDEGLTLSEMIKKCGDEIKCLYIMGENPMVSDPDINHVENALKSLDFLIVQDIFLTETAQLADVVLPSACWAEKDGTFTNTERRVQRIRKAVNPPGDALEDWKIIKKLSEKIGYKELFNYNTPEDIFNEMRKITPQYSGITYEKLGIDGIHWPCISEDDEKGTPILYCERFLTTNGFGKIIPTEYKNPAELPDKDYPYILTTGRIIFHYHTGTMTRRSKKIISEINEGFIEINKEDAKNLDIKNGELVKVLSRRGEVVVKTKITEDIKKGVVFMPFHFSETAANKLTNTTWDPSCKIPELKLCAVKIEKINKVN